MRAHHLAQRAEAVDEPPRGAPGSRSAPEHEPEQLLVVERLGPHALEPFGCGGSDLRGCLEGDRLDAHGRRRYRTCAHQPLTGGLLDPQTGSRTTSKRTSRARATEMPLTVACIAIGASRLPVRS